MKLSFSQYPGRRERHLRRKQDNPLFPAAEQALSNQTLLEAQRQDHEELVAFITGFRKLIYDASRLTPNTGSEIILEMKERLDQAYEQAAGLADDQTKTREAIEKLVAMIMKAVRQGAGNDQTALMELQQEHLARGLHFELLQHPLVADLLSPESPIAEGELTPTLLSSPPAELTAALPLFDKDQMLLLYHEASQLLERTPDVPASARAGLQEMRKRIGSHGQLISKQDPFDPTL